MINIIPLEYFFHSIMSSLIKFTPLSGSKNEHALAYLLEIDNAKILLDCGWNTSFNVNDIHLKILNKLNHPFSKSLFHCLLGWLNR